MNYKNKSRVLPNGADTILSASNKPCKLDFNLLNKEPSPLRVDWGEAEETGDFAIPAAHAPQSK